MLSFEVTEWFMVFTELQGLFLPLSSSDKNVVQDVDEFSCCLTPTSQ